VSAVVADAPSDAPVQPSLRRMREFAIRPDRELGQNFLIDSNILGVIERAAELHREDVVLEVGGGLGVLSEHLAQRVAHVHVVELDEHLRAGLLDATDAHENVSVHWGDALQLDLASLQPSPTKLVANLPYNIATPLIVESLDGLPELELWCVMVQREVADRLFAKPSTKAYGAVSVLIQLATQRTGLHPVSRTVFRPPPNVNSALVAFRRTGLPDDFPRLKKVVTAAFAHRRKTLSNSLALAGWASREEIAERRTATDLHERTDVLSQLLLVEGDERLSDHELRDQLVTLLLEAREERQLTRLRSQLRRAGVGLRRANGVRGAG